MANRGRSGLRRLMVHEPPYAIAEAFQSAALDSKGHLFLVYPFEQLDRHAQFSGCQFERPRV